MCGSVMETPLPTISCYSLYCCPVPCILIVFSELSSLIGLCIPGETEAIYLPLLSQFTKFSTVAAHLGRLCQV